MRGAHDVEPQAAAEAFQRSFTAKYGELQPQWQDCGWQAATSQSHSQFKFLFVYLHAPHHQVKSLPLSFLSVLCLSVQ